MVGSYPVHRIQHKLGIVIFLFTISAIISSAWAQSSITQSENSTDIDSVNNTSKTDSNYYYKIINLDSLDLDSIYIRILKDSAKIDTLFKEQKELEPLDLAKYVNKLPLNSSVIDSIYKVGSIISTDTGVVFRQIKIDYLGPDTSYSQQYRIELIISEEIITKLNENTPSIDTIFGEQKFLKCDSIFTKIDVHISPLDSILARIDLLPFSISIEEVKLPERGMDQGTEISDVTAEKVSEPVEVGTKPKKPKEYEKYDTLGTWIEVLIKSLSENQD